MAWRTSSASPAPVLVEGPAGEPASPRGVAARRGRRCRGVGGWSGGAEREIAFRPARVLMQDFTGVPAVVDLAAMRDAMADLGGGRIDPLLPVDLVIDHSVTVDAFGTADAFARNVEIEYAPQRRALPDVALGAAGVRQLPGRAAGHRHLPPGEPRVPGAGRVGRRRRTRLPGHARRHRLPHADGQRSRRRRVGRRRHRSGGGAARPAGVAAHPQGDRRRAHR